MQTVQHPFRDEQVSVAHAEYVRDYLVKLALRGASAMWVQAYAWGSELRKVGVW